MMSEPGPTIDVFGAVPAIAILRGVTPDDILPIASALIRGGFSALEITMNSPHAIQSINKAAEEFGDSCLIGAGTVTTAAQVDAVADAGGKIIISPNTHSEVISRTVKRGLVSCPGCLTPSDCFSAIAAGAHFLKFFPASTIGPNGIKAILATLPDKPVLAVGGVCEENFRQYAEVGVAGFGIGSALYSAGCPPEEVEHRAKSICKALHFMSEM